MVPFIAFILEIYQEEVIWGVLDLKIKFLLQWNSSRTFCLRRQTLDENNISVYEKWTVLVQFVLIKIWLGTTA